MKAMKKAKKAGLVLVVTLMMTALLTASALSHEGRAVGAYHLVVGFNIEPALIDEPNGVFLRVTKEAHQEAKAHEEGEAGDTEMSLEEHGAIFLSKALDTGDTFSFTVEHTLEGKVVPYHSHLDPDASGSIKISGNARLSGQVEIEIHAGAFHPSEIEVKPETTLVWTNKDSKHQAVTSGLHPGGGHSHEGESEPKPVEGLADTLKVKVSQGSESREFTLSPLFGEPGAYVAHFIPTAVGTYVFHFSGTIEGMQINETFESGPGRFSDVEEKAKLSFPKERLSPAEVQDQLQAAGQATTFGVIGIALGAIGTLLGLGALLGRRRA